MNEPRLQPTTERKGADLSLPTYVLITPARNEEAFIERTIESMIRQTIRPLKWVIVDDGSMDGTAEIINRHRTQYPWIEMVQMPEHRNRNFAAKVTAFKFGYRRLEGLDYEILGNVDADVSFGPDYCEFLLGKFREDNELGVAGTVFEEFGYSSARQSFEGQNHVAGGCQLFRKNCFDQIGGFQPNKAGGVDWIAVTTARMMGWKTRSFREKSFFHHRRLGTAGRGAVSATFSYGEKDYYLGGHPLWELFRVVYRMSGRPYVIDGAALGLGYLWAFLRRTPRPVSRQLMAFHRNEQMKKLAAIFKSLLTFRGVDNFTVMQDSAAAPRQIHERSIL
jgi:poly-beta-1,6-N-acetyl-D-glucosamine synthase